MTIEPDRFQSTSFAKASPSLPARPMGKLCFRSMPRLKPMPLRPVPEFGLTRHLLNVR